MGIEWSKEEGLFKLDTKRTTYMIGLSPEGYMGNVYYGRRLKGMGGKYLLRMEEPPYTPSRNEREKSSFLDYFATEYPVGGIGDYRESCLDVENEQGCIGCELLFKNYEIRKGKPALEGLPASFGTEDEVETLLIYCEDKVLDLEVCLQYSVFAEMDVITRSAKIRNMGSQKLRLQKAYSVCLDMENKDFEMITLCHQRS